MIRDITLGRYYSAESVVHGLDPRVKLSGALLFIIGLFFVKQPLFFLPAAIYIIALYRLAEIPLKYMFKGLKGFVILLLFTLIFRGFCTEGEPIFVLTEYLVLTREGIVKAVQMVGRIMLMIMGASLLTYTATPSQLSAGIEEGCAWMEKIKVPVHEMAMMISIALRFLPIMIEETNLIMDAQASRGVNFHEGSLWTRMKKVFPIVMPLFMGAFKRSANLAMAMEARGYRDAAHRSRLKELRYTGTDRRAYAIIWSYTVLWIGVNLAWRFYE